MLFYRPTQYFSEVVVSEIVDKGIIDGILHLIALAFYRFGYYMLRIEQLVFGNGVDKVKDWFLALTKESRLLQTGNVQEYALVSTLIVSALVIVILLINSGWFAQLF